MFSIFTLSYTWILINVLLTIIIDGFIQVKLELIPMKNQYEIWDYGVGLIIGLSELEKYEVLRHTEPQKEDRIY